MTDIRELQVKPEQVQRYGVYTFRTATRDGTVYARSFLVIRNGYGVIVGFPFYGPEPDYRAVHASPGLCRL